jgi:hypothetical protein
MTLDEAIACVNLMGWYIDAWRMEDGLAIDYDFCNPDDREKLAHTHGGDRVYIDVKATRDRSSELLRDTYERSYEEAVKAFIEWVESGLQKERDRDNFV